MHAIHNKWRKTTGRKRAAKQKAGQAGAEKRWRRDPTPGGDSAAQPNQEESVAGPSGSAWNFDQKNQLFQSEEELPQSDNSGSDYFIVHKSTFPQLTASWDCPICASPVNTDFSDAQGFAWNLKAKCSQCEEVVGQATTSPRFKKDDTQRPPFDVNRKMVESFISLGLGYAAVEKFGMELGMNILSASGWKKHLQGIEKNTSMLKSKILEEAQSAVRKHHNCENGTLDLTVSVDGTWQKRGHISNHGAGFVIEYDTGLLVDYEILSRYCHICQTKAASMEESSPEFEEWFAKHKDLGECQVTIIIGKKIKSFSVCLYIFLQGQQ